MTAGVGSCIDEDYSDEADGDFPVSAGDVVVIDGAFIRNIGYIEGVRYWMVSLLSVARK